MASQRSAQCREFLLGRRRTMRHELATRIQAVRTTAPKEISVGSVGDDGWHVDSQDEIDVAVIQMKADALRDLDEALRRLDTGEYGQCVDCHGAISSRRLEAQPFALRCHVCEGIRERHSGLGGVVRSRAHDPPPLF